ncbi:MULTISPECIES: LysE family translocator [Legionella]|uniref:LysE type translocator n=1 Tax=Legionella drozanskii LLAP-1 TaxID=1212489 RepID=A0A0W0TE26_9GAMM|nr:MULTISPECIES: LysE family translocator [Legionella]KTC93810.1 LysE type translocator [Legionella drozanskii LLAP-1]PJE13534.1 MAG: LysE family translocator [Legionella sp.]
MTITESIIAFIVAGGLLTIVPGLDTALVLRTSAAEGIKKAGLAALGVNVGCLAWGVAVAFGLGALIATSHLAYDILKWSGAIYLAWLGLYLLIKPRNNFSIASKGSTLQKEKDLGWFWKGICGNLLNPKVGIFYISFLPQFIPQGVPVAAYTVLLAVIHAILGLLWFSLLLLASQPLTRGLKNPKIIRRLDRLTGGLFLGFGIKIALSSR